VIENTFDRNVLTLTTALTLTLTLTLKRNYVFGLTKWRHFSIKCNDTLSFFSIIAFPQIGTKAALNNVVEKY